MQMFINLLSISQRVFIHTMYFNINTAIPRFVRTSDSALSISAQQQILTIPLFVRTPFSISAHSQIVSLVISRVISSLQDYSKTIVTFLNVQSHKIQLTNSLKQNIFKNKSSLLSFQLSFRLVRIFVDEVCSFTTVIYFRLVRFSKVLNALILVCYLD